MQVDPAVPLPPAPLEPTCHQIFKTGPCADSWRNYNQAMQQHIRADSAPEAGTKGVVTKTCKRFFVRPTRLAW
jgi:hypothetical protein